MAYVITTLNPDIFKNIPGRVQVVTKSPGRVAGTRQALLCRDIREAPLKLAQRAFGHCP